MSETFTKIGGYIASGDALVYGDANTISGSGTVADPFGVKTQQLFVQAPLFTGTSGEGSATSGYIGCNLNETVLWSGNANPGGTATYVDLAEPISAFNEIGVYTNFENMYGPKLTRFDTQNATWSIEPNTDVYLLGVANCHSLKPQESNTLYNAYYSFGCSTDYSKMYFLGGHVYLNGSSANSFSQFSGICWLKKVVGINRKQ